MNTVKKMLVKLIDTLKKLRFNNSIYIALGLMSVRKNLKFV